jgi:hypothetical protein
MRRFLVAVVACFVVCSPPLFAWHAKGHMAVAFVACQLLTPPIRARVDSLLTRNPSIDDWRNRVASAPAGDRRQLIFMLAAVWPDDIRRDTAYTETGDTETGPRAGRNIGYRDKLRHKYWHFVDRPFSDDHTTLAQPAAVNAQERIDLFRQALGSSASDSVKSYDLVWLEHLVGDVHQPLHCTSRFSSALTHGDRGGNSVKLVSGCAECGGANELHGFWDGVVGETNRATVAATFGATLTAADATPAADADIDHWITESFDLARSKVYMNPPIGVTVGPFSILSGYRSDALNLSKKQIALAGARLANLINTSLR